MKPLFSLGPITLYFFGLMIAIGVLIGLLLFKKESKRRGYNYNLLMDGAVYSIIGGIIGARIVYVFVYNPSYYLSNPIEILFIHQGGLSIHGGIIGGLAVGFWFLKRHQLPIWKTLDMVAPSLILAQGISRIGCDVFGGPISSAFPWGVEVAGEYLHPAQAYEFLLDYLLFGYLWLRLKKPSYDGQVFAHYLIGYMVIRGTVEFTRTNPMVFGLISVSHIMSILGITLGVILILFLRKQKMPVSFQKDINKIDYIKTSAFVFTMMIVSLVIYYWVQA